MAKKAALAYSGGLDTSYLTLLLKQRGWDVLCVTVDTGGFQPGEIETIAARAKKLGAGGHVAIDARQAVYDRYVSYIIKGNILRGGVYPLCVAAERVQQAIATAEFARANGCQAVAHGSTGAGNDQVRFDAALRVVAPELEIIAPVRDERISRPEAAEKLEAAGVEVPAKTTEYSINVSLWGTTIGGRETHDPWQSPPEDVYRITRSIERAAPPVEITLGFEAGLPVSLDGKACGGPELILKLNEIAGQRGVGRGIHLGDTILGIKGRIAFEAPAPIVLIRAHRELEKLVLTKWQSFWKQQMAEFYGNMLHEGLYFDPVCRDIEQMLDSSQQRVTGEVRVLLAAGQADVRGVRSPHSLMDAGVARYGESNAYWDGADARGFCKLYPLQATLAARRQEEK
ncbi:MAG: argininosuccinate synthase [Planctomycetes bacterium]|nr:argininosuccinate synthase [Planctomycetota bacterium]